MLILLKRLKTIFKGKGIQWGLSSYEDFKSLSIWKRIPCLLNLSNGFKAKESHIKHPLKFPSTERGLAIIETIPLLFILVLLTGFSIGLFNVIHTGILHSIAARNYAFETLRYKSDAIYFRNLQGTVPSAHFRDKEVRFHTIISAGLGNEDRFVPSKIPISFFPSHGRTPDNSDDVHQRDISEIASKRRFGDPKRGSNPVWLRVGYGICINSSCGND